MIISETWFKVNEHTTAKIEQHTTRTSEVKFSSGASMIESQVLSKHTHTDRVDLVLGQYKVR